ncbi:MAG: hypothetical protein U0587_01055 [Candidatus Binatia bacterium]
MPVATSSRAAAVARLAQLSLPGRVHLGAAPEPVRRFTSGVAAIDALCDGGVPCGRISELLGPVSSGKTSLLLTCLAAATRRGELAACVDLADALHPASVADAGADLQRLLWVRPPALTAALRCTEVLLHAGGFAVVALDLGVPLPRRLPPHVWPRLLQAAERSHTALIVLAPHRVAGSFAVLSLGLRPRRPLWCRGLWPLFDGFETVAAIVRNKLGMPGRQIAVQVVDRSAVDSRRSIVNSSAPELSTIDARHALEAR